MPPDSRLDRRRAKHCRVLGAGVLFGTGRRKWNDARRHVIFLAEGCDRYDLESSLVTRVMTTMNRFSVSGSEGGISAPHAAAVALARAVGCGRLERRDTL